MGHCSLLDSLLFGFSTVASCQPPGGGIRVIRILGTTCNLSYTSLTPTTWLGSSALHWLPGSPEATYAHSIFLSASRTIPTHSSEANGHISPQFLSLPIWDASGPTYTFLAPTPYLVHLHLGDRYTVSNVMCVRFHLVRFEPSFSLIKVFFGSINIPLPPCQSRILRSTPSLCLSMLSKKNMCRMELRTELFTCCWKPLWCWCSAIKKSVWI